MARNHKKRNVIRIICTDQFHCDEPSGHHYIGTLAISSDGKFRWYGPHWESVPVPLKPTWEAPEDIEPTARFRCTCGRDAQRKIDVMGKIMAIIGAEQPETGRVVLDIARL